MAEPTQEQIDRLPKWAQRELQHLEYEAAGLKRRVAELENGEDDTGTRARAGSSLAWYPLPRHQHYEFDLDGDHNKVQVFVRDEHGERSLEINSVYGALEIQPRSSNLIRVKGVD